MGCGASYEEVADNYVHEARDNKTYGIIKSNYGAPDLKMLRDGKETVFMRPVFVGEPGSKETIFLLTTKSTVDVSSTNGGTHRDSMVPSDEDDEEGESGDDDRGTLSRKKKKDDNQTERVRWGIYNDSSNTAVLTCTFHHAGGVVVLDDDAEVEELSGDKLRITSSISSAETLRFVEGAITSYKWTCSLVDRKGTSEELTALAVKK